MSTDFTCKHVMARLRWPSRLPSSLPATKTSFSNFSPPSYNNTYITMLDFEEFLEAERAALLDRMRR